MPPGETLSVLEKDRWKKDGTVTLHRSYSHEVEGPPLIIELVPLAIDEEDDVFLVSERNMPRLRPGNLKRLAVSGAKGRHRGLGSTCLLCECELVFKRPLEILRSSFTRLATTLALPQGECLATVNASSSSFSMGMSFLV